VNATANLPFSTIVNPEVLYQSYQLNYGFYMAATAIIDSNLYNSYQNNDLRRQVFFRNNASTGTYFFKGSYVGNNTILFGGLATDEMYFTRAECNARLGRTQAALGDLNTVLSKRWKTGTFPPFTASNPDDALQKNISGKKKGTVLPRAALGRPQAA